MKSKWSREKVEKRKILPKQIVVRSFQKDDPPSSSLAFYAWLLFHYKTGRLRIASQLTAITLKTAINPPSVDNPLGNS